MMVLVLEQLGRKLMASLSGFLLVPLAKFGAQIKRAIFSKERGLLNIILWDQAGRKYQESWYRSLSGKHKHGESRKMTRFSTQFYQVGYQRK